VAAYDLKTLQENAIYEVENELMGKISLNNDWPDFRHASRQVCDNFMTLATASLLANMKPTLFFQNLRRSAENWRRYLISSRDHYNTPSPLHYNAPLYAAILTEDRTLLNELKQTMPTQWQKGEEYEDKFHVSWLHLLLSINGCQLDKNIEQHLLGLENCAPDNDQVELFKTLLGLEELLEEDFWSQFEHCLYAYEEMVEKRVSAMTTSVTQFAPHRFIWFEGLTWIRLAAKKGFKLPTSHYLFCPDEALEKTTENYLNDWLIVPVPV
jgi:hypothetical protein